MKLSPLTRTTPQRTTPASAGWNRQSAKSRKGQRGFDLIQIAIVIGVIGILMAGAFLGVPAVMASVRATGEAQDIQTYVNNQQAQLNNSLAINNESVIADKLYNPDMVVDTKTLRNRFSGTTVIDGKAGVADFTVTSTQVPRRACEKLLPVVAPLFEVITVGGQPVKNSRQEQSIVLTKAALSSACSNDVGVVTIVYTATR